MAENEALGAESVIRLSDVSQQWPAKCKINKSRLTGQFNSTSYNSYRLDQGQTLSVLASWIGLKQTAEDIFAWNVPKSTECNVKHYFPQIHLYSVVLLLINAQLMQVPIRAVTLQVKFTHLLQNVTKKNSTMATYSVILERCL